MAVLGCVADDFTGAGDAASFLAKSGLSVVLTNGIPQSEDTICADAVVIALKSRTQKTASAVADSLKAVKWLKEAGANQFYVKYCSTFDSTPKGNIGPIADAVMEYLDTKYTLLCPGLPANGRTVLNGCLLVSGVPLNESYMKNHPLTPMWDSRISNLMRPQSRYDCLELNLEEMSCSDEEITKTIGYFACHRDHFYIIPDHIDDRDGQRIADLFGGCELLTGGSGILEMLGRRMVKEHSQNAETFPDAVQGSAILLAGSCSNATLAQIAYFLRHGGRGYKIDPIALIKGQLTFEDIWSFVCEAPNSPALIYSSDTPENVKGAQAYGQDKVSSKLESIMSDIAKQALDNGCRRIIVAGGETSGAVMHGLGFSSFRIGTSVAPGVPVMAPVGAPDVRLVLKSGNFGQEDFFERALSLTGGRIKGINF